MQGPWELDPEGKHPALYIDAPDGGDPLIVASIKRIHRPDVLQAMGLPHKLPPPPDEIARLRAEVERLTAALADERRHADALAEALEQRDGSQLAARRPIRSVQPIVHRDINGISSGEAAPRPASGVIWR